MKILDGLFLVVISFVALNYWFQGHETAAEAAPIETQAKGILATGGSFTLPALNLPPGLRVDPATGLLLGVALPTIKGVEGLSWELLRTYEYRQDLAGMPDTIKKLDGKKVVMIGFLMTLFQYDDIKEFHLVASHWSCCYGVPPGLDGAVRVNLPEGAEGLPNTIKPLRVIGTLHVREVKEEESDIVWAIYTIEDAEATILDY